MKKIRQALKAHILGTAWRIQLKFGIGGPPGIHTENFVCFCSGSVELQMRENGVFFTPVKYTLVCCAPQVSWAAQHTTVCLEIRTFHSRLNQCFSGTLLCGGFRFSAKILLSASYSPSYFW